MGRKSGGDIREQITVKLTPDILERLDEFCRVNFRAERSTVIEEAVKLFLEQGGRKRGDSP
jgi:metal-responsive CopG/Arc/MetJ family transcriptional regulator